MKLSDKGLALIQRFEGCSLRAYRDCAGVWTIGWGTTNADKAITRTTIKRGLVISKAQAEAWLRKSIAAKYEPKVNKYDSIYCWSQNEFDALVSFAYNIGNIDQLTANGKRSRGEIREAWLLYCKAGGRKVRGLLERREAELKLFNTAVSPPTTPENPYPAPVNTVTTNAQAVSLGLAHWQNHGAEVKAVQWELVRLGYDIGKVDGICGPKTLAAIISFQLAAGLKCDGACGRNTWAALVAAKEKPKPPASPAASTTATAGKAEKVDYCTKVAKSAEKVYPLCVGKVHSGANVGKVVDLASLKKYKALSCNRMVSIVLQEAGLLPKGVIVSHTPKRSGKKTIADAVKNAGKLKHCKVVWVNKKFADLPKEYQKAGCVYFQNSNACISAGGGKIWSCNKSKGYRYKGKGDYLRTSGYPFTSNILVVVVPDCN